MIERSAQFTADGEDSLFIRQMPSVGHDETLNQDYACADCGQEMGTINVDKHGTRRCTVCHVNR